MTDTINNSIQTWRKTINNAIQTWRKTMSSLSANPIICGSEEYLRSAYPRLIVEYEVSGGKLRMAPYIYIIDEDERDEVLDEGYDPHDRALGCPVYWRIVRRDGKQFELSVFPARDLIRRVWGKKGIPGCDPTTDITVAQIETPLHPESTKDTP